MTVEAQPRERRQIYHEGVPSNRTLERFGLTRRPGFVVEFGYGKTPVPINGRLRFGKYAGFDKQERNAEAAKHREVGTRVTFNVADIVKDEGSGLASAVADEVYLGNILNAPFAQGDKDRNALLDEARRVLSRDGRLVIKVSWGKDGLEDFPIERTQELLSDAGFSILGIATNKETEYDELDKRYGKTPWKNIVPAFVDDLESIEYLAYYIVAEKAEP